MTSTDPKHLQRRSQLYRWHQRHNAVFIERSDAAFVDHYTNQEDEVASLQRLAICDLSLLPRYGISGAGSTTWLRANSYELPQPPNTSLLQTDGGLLVRLSDQEFLNLDLPALYRAEKSVDISRWQGDPEASAYPVPRADSHCLFSVSGEHAAPRKACQRMCRADVGCARQRDCYSTGPARNAEFLCVNGNVCG
jgi:sarcosine oxidase subunit gamma